MEINNLRALLVTPERGLFYCFASKKGGDSISLVAHVHGKTVRESAEALAATYLPNGARTSPRVSAPAQPAPKADEETKSSSFNPEEYISKLDTGHELVKTAGVSEELAHRMGAGVPTKGVHKGRFTFPVYDRQGGFLFFASATEFSVPKQWRGT